MTRRARRQSDRPADVPEPVDVADGIPDCSADRAAWKYVLLVSIFLAWLAFLVYCQVAGRVQP